TESLISFVKIFQVQLGRDTSNIYNLYSEIRRAVSSESMLLAGIGLRILVEAIANDLKYKRINCNLKLQK
ncbi:MAG: hypothetical protein ACI38O_01735, partial [Fibrobacter intestinalis]|uniref:hypothetical protein n=1 Tax=Fibrobacter intestinalis TaxID=28122 RepID=UPI003F06C5A9